MAGGRRWTAAEVDTLERMRAAKADPAEIAAALGRSVKALHSKNHMLSPAGAERRRRLAQRYSSLEVPKDDPGIVGERPFKDNFEETERRWREAFTRSGESGSYA